MNVWEPNKRQADFVSIPDSVFEAFYGGAAFGGKSEILMMLPIIKQWYQHSGWKGILFRRTYPELEREIILRSQEYYPATGGIYNDAKKRWSWPSFGTHMQFGYAEHEQDVRKYDTTEYNYMAFDELTSFTEFQYMYLTFSRCRSSDPTLPAVCRSGSNPGNTGHGFVRKRFVEPCISGYVIIKDRATGLTRIFIPAKAEDNIVGMKADPNYVNKLRLLPEAEYRAKALGDWWTFSGQVFDEYRMIPFPGEPEHACHVIKPFQIPSYWPRILALDWGYAAMMYAIWGAINPETKQLVGYREYAAKKTKISTWAVDVARQSSEEILSDVVLDPSAWAHRGDENTIAEQFEYHSGLTPRKADNDRLGGKTIVQEMLRWTPRPPKYVPKEGFNQELALKIHRMHGEKAYQEYCRMFDPEPEEQYLPKILFFDDLKVMQECIPLCVYDQKVKEDVAEFDGDDPYDTLRYLCKAYQYYFQEGGVKEHQQAAQIAAAVESLNRTGNMTGFYMKMDRIDAANKAAGGLNGGFQRRRTGRFAALAARNHGSPVRRGAR